MSLKSYNDNLGPEVKGQGHKGSPTEITCSIGFMFPKQANGFSRSKVEVNKAKAYLVSFESFFSVD